MKVKELIEMLNKVNSEYDIAVSYVDEENADMFDTIYIESENIEVIEDANTFSIGIKL